MPLGIDGHRRILPHNPKPRRVGRPPGRGNGGEGRAGKLLAARISALCVASLSSRCAAIRACNARLRRWRSVSLAGPPQISAATLEAAAEYSESRHPIDEWSRDFLEHARQAREEGGRRPATGTREVPMDPSP